MALGWRTLHAMPRLYSYADAERREANTKPIRGRTPETKPLGRRNQAWYNIKRAENGDILVQCGDTPILRYRPDDTLLIYDVGYWNKATFNDLICEVAGIRTETKDRKMWAHVDEGKYIIRPNPKATWVGNKWQPPEDSTIPENIFKRVEKFAHGHTQAHGYLTWSYVNPPTNTVHAIRRKQMRIVRERYAAFTAYATALDSIREGRPQPAEYEEPFGVKFEKWHGSTHYTWNHKDMPETPHDRDFNHVHAAELTSLMLSEDATDNYKAYLWLNVRRDWYTSNTASLIDRVLIMHHHNEVLTERDATAGHATKDRYAWAVPKGGQTA